MVAMAVKHNVAAHPDDPLGRTLRLSAVGHPPPTALGTVPSGHRLGACGSRRRIGGLVRRFHDLHRRLPVSEPPRLRRSSASRPHAGRRDDSPRRSGISKVG